MKSKEAARELNKGNNSWKLPSLMQCLCTGEELKIDQKLPLAESLGEVQRQLDAGNIGEAESALRDGSCLNFEEARALLGRYEYQKGNVEAALHVFEGIDVAAVTPRVKLTLARQRDRPKKRSPGDPSPPMSIHAVGLLFEAMLLKAKCLQSLSRFKDAAQSCKVILDIVESSLPAGLPEKFGGDSRLQEIIIRAVELLPELWKVADCTNEAILSYRQALMHHWNLDVKTIARIQKEFAVYLLYSGAETNPPNLLPQTDTSFVPKSSLEEAILLLMLLLKKMTCRVIQWDPSVLDHLKFALSVANQPRALASVLEELPAGIVERRELYYSLALCYHDHGDRLAALNLLRKLLHHSEDPQNIPGLLMASKLCSEVTELAEEGVAYARRALEMKEDGCHHTAALTHYFLGMSLSEYAKSAVADSEKVTRQSEALQALECAGKLTNLEDSCIVYCLSLEYAEQRKLDVALTCAMRLLKMELGCNSKGLLLLARILSGQKRLEDAVTVIDAAIDQIGKWDQDELLRTKAKLQIAQGQLKRAIETYSKLLANVQVKSKSSGSRRELDTECRNQAQHLELQTWLDLAGVYILLSRWNDAEVCLSKAKVISPHCASRWHTIGSLHEARGSYKEALNAFTMALTIDPCHAPSLVSSALLLKRLGGKSSATIRSYLMNALKHDRMNHVAWYNLGLLYKNDDTLSFFEAAECFETAAFLEETAPVEPFR